jgi:hypothetical protein
MQVTENIPAEKLEQFHEILVATGGRYLRNPFPLWSVVQVHYEPGDYAAQREAWARCVTPIREARRDQWWRKTLRRCLPGFVLRHLKV